MSTLSLVAKICSSNMCAITVGNAPTEHKGPSAVFTEDNGSILEIETPLVPLSHVSRNELYIETFIQPETVNNPVLCKIEDTMFTWELLGHPFVGDYIDLGAYWIKITAENLDLCNFEGAKIKGEHAGLIKEYEPSSGGNIPQRTALSVTDEAVVFQNSNEARLEHTPDGDVTWLWYGNNLGTPTFDGTKVTAARSGTSVLKCSYDTFLPADDALEIDETFDNTNDPQVQGDPMVVPGERISLWWKIAGVDNYEEVAHAFIHTCLLTGGRITAISGDYGDPDITYSVRIEGTVYNGVKSSDFREYAVNEWVYIMKPLESGAASCGREEGCKGEDYSGGGVIIPIHITGVSP